MGRLRVYYPTFPHHLPETLLTRCRGGCPHPPSRRQARNIGEDGWFVQPTFSQTGTQGRAGTPAPTTRLGRVRNILPPSVSSHTICCEVVIVIPTFPVVPRKGRRGRRPLRLGGGRTFPQPYIAVPSGRVAAHRGRCALHGSARVRRSRVFVHPAQIRPLKNTPKTPVRMCESDEIASYISALKCLRSPLRQESRPAWLPSSFFRL